MNAREGHRRGGGLRPIGSGAPASTASCPSQVERSPRLRCPPSRPLSKLPPLFGAPLGRGRLSSVRNTLLGRARDGLCWVFVRPRRPLFGCGRSLTRAVLVGQGGSTHHRQETPAQLSMPSRLGVSEVGSQQPTMRQDGRRKARSQRAQRKGWLGWMPSERPTAACAAYWQPLRPMTEVATLLTIPKSRD